MNLKHQALSAWLKEVARLLRRLAMATMLFLFLWGGVYAAPPPQPVFTDDFNDDNDNGWTQINRNWHVIDGRYYLDGCYGCDGVPTTGGRDGFSYTHVDDPNWTDYTFEFTFDTTNAGGSPPEAHQAMVFFRVQGPLPGPSGAPTQYRLDFCVPCEQANGEFVALYKYLNGNPTPEVLASTFNPGVLLVGTNIGKVIAMGGHFQVVVNNQMVVDVTDPDPIHFGGIGLGGIWEVNAWFDNVSVTSELFSVGIDIQPGRDPNVINLRHTRIIRVAVLSTSTFDALAAVNRNSLTFGHTGDEDSLRRNHGVPSCGERDINGDSLPDLVCAFRGHLTGFQCGDTVGILKGARLDGELFTAQDAVVIESCPP